MEGSAPDLTNVDTDEMGPYSLPRNQSPDFFFSVTTSKESCSEISFPQAFMVFAPLTLLCSPQQRTLGLCGGDRKMTKPMGALPPGIGVIIQ